MRTSNPALSTKAWKTETTTRQLMTVDGTVNKTFILFGLLMITAFWTWNQFYNGLGAYDSQMFDRLIPFVWGGALGGFVVALVTIFKKEWAPVTSPVYALLEGLVIGSLSAMLEMLYPGIVVQAVALTFGVLLLMLFLYRSGTIKVTEKFKLGVFAATGAIALVYLATWVLSFFSIQMPFIHDSRPIGIGISLFIVGIAALNLVLDFNFIEESAEKGAPRYMEWFGAFGLMVTLIWLYLEILRLLAKLRD